MIQFQRQAIRQGKAYRVTVSEKDLCSLVSEEVCDEAEVAHLPKDGVWGSVGLERFLARILSGDASE